MKNRLLKGELIELSDLAGNSIAIWFQEKTNNFCLELNAKVIKATKTWKPIQDKLDTFKGLLEQF